MDKKINFDDLKRFHDKARISSPGSKEWIAFATVMLDSFPQIYETAKNMNKEMLNLRNAKEAINVVTLTGKQVKEVLEFINPDGDTNINQLDDEVSIGIFPKGHNFPDGEVLDRDSLFCWSTDYPEEGGLCLDETERYDHSSN